MYQRFSTKSPCGTNNLCGTNIKKYRLSKNGTYSQRMLAEEMQRHGADLDKNMIQRIESGQRYVTDFELKLFSEVLGIPIEDLIKQ